MLKAISVLQNPNPTAPPELVRKSSINLVVSLSQNAIVRFRPEFDKMSIFYSDAIFLEIDAHESRVCMNFLLLHHNGLESLTPCAPDVPKQTKSASSFQIMQHVVNLKNALE